jgi:threonine dehydratase
VEAIFAPFGGGGLSCGIASAVRASRPDVKVIACELDTAHPAKSAFDAGHPGGSGRSARASSAASALARCYRRSGHLFSSSSMM